MRGDGPRLLVVEDDEAIRTGLVDRLGLEGYRVDAAADAGSGLAKARGGDYQCIVLDLMLPGGDGFSICRALRADRNTTPILVLSARDGEGDRVLGLDLGADDYVTKPFSVAELLARLRALIRRTRMGPGALDRLVVGDAVVDLTAHEVRRGERTFELSPTEVKMLRLLAGRRGQVVTRECFLREAWGYSSLPTTRTVDFHILGLRKKLEPRPERPAHILTVHGAGYKLTEES